MVSWGRDPSCWSVACSGEETRQLAREWGGPVRGLMTQKNEALREGLIKDNFLNMSFDAGALSPEDSVQVFTGEVMISVGLQNLSTGLLPTINPYVQTRPNALRCELLNPA